MFLLIFFCNCKDVNAKFGCVGFVSSAKRICGFIYRNNTKKDFDYLILD